MERATGRLGVAALWLIVVLLALQTAMWRADHELYVDEACVTTFLVGGETAEQFNTMVELRQKWC